MKVLGIAFFAASMAFGAAGAAEPVKIRVETDKVVARADRAKLMGVNIAVYNSPRDYESAIEGPLADLQMGLVRIPGGSVSDKFYWNGNGVIRDDGSIDRTRFRRVGKQGYWEVDYSAYRPGFVVDNNDWSKISTDFVRLDARTMHVLTRKHPVARNLVTVNVGTGTPEMAAEWVRWANIKNKWGVKYWELGNELNGTWEAGHIRPDGSKMTGEKYARLFKKFAKAMKAVDPSIKIGGPACDVEHHEDFFTPLLKEAGDQVDFITFHYYSLRDSLAPEKELFDGLENLAPVMKKLTDMVAKYQPDRKDEIEYSITEWNSKLPKDQDAYRLFNGLWFSAWVGEMIRCGVDSSTVWDLFSEPKEGGHGLLVRQGKTFVPTGRYWAFWLWSHCMGDELLESETSGCEDLHVYATRGGEDVFVLVMNESRTKSYPLQMELKNFSPGRTAEEYTFSSREYFWNPYTYTVEWNKGPTRRVVSTKALLDSTVPPYSVKVFRFSSRDLGAPSPKPDYGTPVLHLVFPQRAFADTSVEGFVCALRKGTKDPFGGDLGDIQISVKGPAEAKPARFPSTGAATRFELQPTGPGDVIVTARTASGAEASAAVHFSPVKYEEKTAWTFENGRIEQPVQSAVKWAIVPFPGDASNRVVRIDFPADKEKYEGTHILDILDYPRGISRARIGGVVFRLFIPEDLKTEDEGANLQVVLQSHGAYWIPCGQVSLQGNRGKWRTIRFEIPDRKFLKVMDQSFSILFLTASSKPMKGSLYLDDIGFLLRPERP